MDAGGRRWTKVEAGGRRWAQVVHLKQHVYSLSKSIRTVGFRPERWSIFQGDGMVMFFFSNDGMAMVFENSHHHY